MSVSTWPRSAIAIPPIKRAAAAQLYACQKKIVWRGAPDANPRDCHNFFGDPRLRLRAGRAGEEFSDATYAVLCISHAHAHGVVPASRRRCHSGAHRDPGLWTIEHKPLLLSRCILYLVVGGRPPTTGGRSRLPDGTWWAGTAFIARQGPPRQGGPTLAAGPCWLLVRARPAAGRALWPRLPAPARRGP